MSTPPWTLDGYQQLIAALLSRNYELRSFHDIRSDAQHLVLRHDVDQSILAARKMADVEAARGWRSTWFVLVRTEMYNPFSRAATQCLRAMHAAGHEIGLHLDAVHYGGAEDLDRGCAVECRMLEDIVAAPVRIISFHRPRPEQLGGDTPLAGRLHTYMDRFTRDIGYCSDSRGEWRHGHPLSHAAVQSNRALQLLTHAVWWVGPDGRDARGRLADVLKERTASLDAELAANNQVWAARNRK